MMSLNAILAELLESLTAQIRKAGKQDDYCSITVQPGNAVVFDFGPESGCGGIAWVRLVSANTTVSFPNSDVTVDSCAYTLAYTVEMGMAAPAPIMENHLGAFVLPEDTELFDAAMRQSDELEMMFTALKLARIPEKIIGDYTPQGPEGGVMGGSWTVLVGGDD